MEHHGVLSSIDISPMGEKDRSCGLSYEEEDSLETYLPSLIAN
jgi:hypothetical protein